MGNMPSNILKLLYSSGQDPSDFSNPNYLLSTHITHSTPEQGEAGPGLGL